MRLKLYERAIYGLLCGRIEALIPVCKTYADYLWAYTSCYIEQEIHYTLVYVFQQSICLVRTSILCLEMLIKMN